MDVVNSSTGEIIQSPFRTMYSGIEKTAEDCSDPYQKTYKELPPYAVDPETKKILNKKCVPILVEDEPFNIVCPLYCCTGFDASFEYETIREICRCYELNGKEKGWKKKQK